MLIDTRDMYEVYEINDNWLHTVFWDLPNINENKCMFLHQTMPRIQYAQCTCRVVAMTVKQWFYDQGFIESFEH